MITAIWFAAIAAGTRVPAVRNSHRDDESARSPGRGFVRWLAIHRPDARAIRAPALRCTRASLDDLEVF